MSVSTGAARSSGVGDQASADFEAMLAEAREAFVDWAKRSLGKSKSAAKGLAGDDFAASLETVLDTFHDLKGGGGGVGLSLMSSIGDSACGYLRKLEAPSDHAAKVVEAHIVAAEGVLAAGIEGDGAAAGASLTAKLRAFAA